MMRVSSAMHYITDIEDIAQVSPAGYDESEQRYALYINDIEDIAQVSPGHVM